MIISYGITLVSVTSFEYLGILFLASEYNWPAVANNLWKAQQKWARLSRVLIREGADAWTLGRIYVVVVLEVILYG